MQRIDKILSSQNIASRKEVSRLIKDGQVKVNGVLCKSSSEKYDENTAQIEVCGQAVDYKKNLYIMMNKPSGVLSASNDKNAKTVIDLLPENLLRRNLFPAGRLDKDTQGLLIITDDGDFAHKMLSPKSGIYKRYYAELDGEITEEMVKAFEKGIVFEDGVECLPAKLEPIVSKNGRKDSGYVEICEGKFHQVKKMFISQGLKVTFLKRISIGMLTLDVNLPIGEARELTNLEKTLIFSSKID